jgi:hypothetical protein
MKTNLILKLKTFFDNLFFWCLLAKQNAKKKKKLKKAENCISVQKHPLTFWEFRQIEQKKKKNFGKKKV